MNKIPMADILDGIEFIDIEDDHLEACRHSERYAAFSDKWRSEDKASIIKMCLETEQHIPATVYIWQAPDETRYYFVPISPPRALMIISRYTEIYCTVPEIA